MKAVLRPFGLALSIACALCVSVSLANEVPEAIALPVPQQEGVIIEAHAAPLTTTVAYTTPRVKYRHAHGLHRRSYGQTVETTLAVQDKCTSCSYAIPVCIPACCLDEACVGERRGLLGRQVVVYTWKCGYRLEIVMRLRGDVLVVYHG